MAKFASYCSPRRLNQIFLLWFVVQFGLTTYLILSGEYREMHSAAVNVLAPADRKLPDSVLTVGFMVISFAFFLLTALVGWLFLWLSTKGKTWAKVLFWIYCIAMIYYTVNYAVEIPKMYPERYTGALSNITNCLSALFSTVIFLYLFWGVAKLEKSAGFMLASENEKR